MRTITFTWICTRFVRKVSNRTFVLQLYISVTLVISITHKRFRIYFQKNSRSPYVHAYEVYPKSIGCWALTLHISTLLRKAYLLILRRYGKMKRNTISNTVYSKSRIHVEFPNMGATLEESCGSLEKGSGFKMEYY